MAANATYTFLTHPNLVNIIQLWNLDTLAGITRNTLTVKFGPQIFQNAQFRSGINWKEAVIKATTFQISTISWKQSKSNNGSNMTGIPSQRVWGKNVPKKNVGYILRDCTILQHFIIVSPRKTSISDFPPPDDRLQFLEGENFPKKQASSF